MFSTPRVLPAARLRFVRLCLLSVLGVAAGGQGAASVTGIVVDISGAPVPSATVSLESPGRTVQGETGSDGRFTIEGAPESEFVLRATAAGFAETVERLAASTGSVRIVLYPAPFNEVVTITASRSTTRLDTPASTTVVTSAE